LLFIHRRHANIAALEERFDVAEHVFIQRHVGGIKIFRHDFFGDIVVRRPQAAGEQNHVRTAEGQIQTLADVISIIAHHAHVLHPHIGQIELAAYPRGVGVHDLADEQLVADGDDFCSHKSKMIRKLKLPYTPATTSSITMPQPPGHFSARRTGNGLRMSKIRNNKKPIPIVFKFNGIKAIVTAMPITSSITTSCGSTLPDLACWVAESANCHADHTEVANKPAKPRRQDHVEI
jgi:hypothetical protein